jgi:hypothetical protein
MYRLGIATRKGFSPKPDGYKIGFKSKALDDYLKDSH